MQQELNKDIFDDLPIENQLNIVNEKAENGVSLNQFAKDLGVTESKIRKRFNKLGYFKNKETGLYEFKEGFEVIKKTSTVKKDTKPKTKTVTADIDILQRLIDLEKEVELLKSQFNTSGKAEGTNTQEDNLKALESHLEGDTQGTSDLSGLNIRGFEGEVKQISYRYHKEVLKAFDKLCDMYPHYTKQKILNTLLMESIEKYL